MIGLHSPFCILNSALEGWLPDMDLNHDKQIQSLLCYRYTIGQTAANSLGNARAESRVCIRTVTQISNLLYRRFSICGSSGIPSASADSNRQQNGILRYSRLEFCATAAVPASNPQHAIRNT